VSAPGALVLGSDYRGLGAIQSLGRHGIQAWLVRGPHRGVADYSRYTRRTVVWPEGSAEDRAAFLVDLADRNGLRDWVILPSGDETAAFCGMHAGTLGRAFRLTTPAWEIVEQAHDKRLTYRLAAEIGVPHPRTWELGEVDPADADCTFPAILKPSAKDANNALTVDKAWPVHDRAELDRRFADAVKLLPRDQILLQELIPGGGNEQLSFAALAVDGDPVCFLVARRVRQYPMDIGRASTFVETIRDDEVRSLGERVVAHLKYTGLIEVEFKRDPRTAEPKLLDINPRMWGWHTIGRRAGMDFAHLAFELAQGSVPARRQAPSGVKWVWPAGDVPTALREIARRRLSPREYLRSFRRPVDLATVTLDDPKPGLMEVPLQLAIRLRDRRATRPDGVGGASPASGTRTASGTAA
jgi:predicted ATP-grasp superfamily ATP-dependent carboligase